MNFTFGEKKNFHKSCPAKVWSNLKVSEGSKAFFKLSAQSSLERQVSMATNKPIV